MAPSSVVNCNNIFNPSLSNSRYAANDSSKWILSKLDTHTDRIINSYKKEAAPQRIEETQQESIKTI